METANPLCPAWAFGTEFQDEAVELITRLSELDLEFKRRRAGYLNRREELTERLEELRTTHTKRMR